MGSITRTLGRILFITILASSAYFHLNKPQNTSDEAQQNYSHFLQCFNTYAPGVLPPAETVNWILIVKVFGLFEALCGLLIFFGDGLGGILLFISLLVEGYFNYHSSILNIIQWDVQKQLEFARFLFFIGASLTMICTNFNKKTGKCAKSCC